MKIMNRIFLSMLLSVFVLGVQVKAQDNASEELKSMAEFESKTYDFGKIEQGKPVKAKFVVKNTSMVPLVITNVKPTCGCTVANYTKDPIKPGETGTIEATYNARAMGRFTKTVHVYTNSSEPMIDVYLKGEVVPKEQLEAAKGE